MSALHYYVYYKVDPAQVAQVAQADQLRASIEALFREVASATGVQGRLQRRRDDPSTYMEIYADVPAACDFGAALETALRKVDFARLVRERVTEVFQCA